jgi:hypothetical protein
MSTVSLPVAALRIALALRRGINKEIRRARDAVCGTQISCEHDRRVKIALHQEMEPEAWKDDLPLPRPGSRSGIRARQIREAEAIEAWALPQISAHQRMLYRDLAAKADAEAAAAWRRRGDARRRKARGETPTPLFFDTA